MSKSKYTINDVAKAAGVSKATVSYVLNQREAGFRISESTKATILEICEKFNYRPDQTSVLLARHRSEQVKLLVLNPWMDDSYTELTHQLNCQLRKSSENFPINVRYLPYDRSNIGQVLRPSYISAFDAVMVAGVSTKGERYLAKRAGEFPKLIMINRNIPGYSSIYVDDEKGAKELVRRIDLNKYKRFIVIEMPHTASFLDKRSDGFAAGITEKHKKVERLVCENSNNLWQELFAQSDLKKTPTLIMIPLYTSAAMLLKDAHRFGAKVPEELGIAAYDVHSLLENFIEPAITTVDPDLPAMINAGVEIACRKKTENKIVTKKVKAVIKLGGSTCNLSDMKNK